MAFDESSPSYGGSINTLGHTRGATREDRFVVTPINDAVYSRAFVVRQVFLGCGTCIADQEFLM